LASQEGLVLDTTLDLNQLNGPLGLEEALQINAPRKRIEWATAADADGAALVRDPLVETREIVAKLRVGGAGVTMDQALAQIGALVDKLEEAERQDNGLPLVWTPANASKSTTFYVLTGEIEDLPVSIEAGWLAAFPVVTVHFYCKPYGYGPRFGTEIEDFSVNTLGNYTGLISPLANLTVTGGVLKSNGTAPTSEYHLHRTSGVSYPNGYYDNQQTVKWTVGALTSAQVAGVRLKSIDTNNAIEVFLHDNATASFYGIRTRVAGVVTNRVLNATTRFVAGSSYWVRGRVEGNVVYVELWTSAPTATGTPAASASWTLTGSEITALGQGVAGYAGLIFTPVNTSASLDDWTVEPNVWVSSNPIVTGTIPGIPGDVPAEVNYYLTERSNQNRRFVELGAEQRYFNPSSPTANLIDSEDLATSGFAGVQATRTGAYRRSGAVNDVVRGTLGSITSAIAGTGNLPHVGTYRVRARAYASSASVQARLSWQVGSGRFQPNSWVTPPVYGTFVDLDLGTVSIPPASSGTQQWSGRIEAFGAEGDTLDIDHLVLVPTEFYGKARGNYTYAPGAVVGYDNFTGTTAGNALNLRTAPAGGAWATSGEATDFAFADPAAPVTSETLSRQTGADATTGRFALLGGAYTDTEARFDWQVNNGGLNPITGVVARYVDASNYLRALTTALGAGYGFFRLVSTVAGVNTTLAEKLVYTTPGAWYTQTLIAYSSGRIIALLSSGGAELARMDLVSSVVATGGALASGKAGINDFNNGGGTRIRYYDSFAVGTPAPEPIVLYPGKQLAIAPDSAQRGDLAGVYGPVAYRGGRPYLPPAGVANRTTRIVAKCDRNDIEVGEDVPLGDSLQLAAVITPRHYAIPR
jgi:hypothetical protein